jgi:hypothetical protein
MSCVVLNVWGRREMHTEFWWGKLKERDYTEDVRRRRGRGGNIMSGIKEMGWEGVNWINVAKDGEKSWSVVKAVINLRVP